MVSAEGPSVNAGQGRPMAAGWSAYDLLLGHTAAALSLGQGCIGLAKAPIRHQVEPIACPSSSQDAGPATSFLPDKRQRRGGRSAAPAPHPRLARGSTRTPGAANLRPWRRFSCQGTLARGSATGGTDSPTPCGAAEILIPQALPPVESGGNNGVAVPKQP